MADNGFFKEFGREARKQNRKIGNKIISGAKAAGRGIRAVGKATGVTGAVRSTGDYIGDRLFPSPTGADPQGNIISVEKPRRFRDIVQKNTEESLPARAGRSLGESTALTIGVPSEAATGQAGATETPTRSRAALVPRGTSETTSPSSAAASVPQADRSSSEGGGRTINLFPDRNPGGSSFRESDFPTTPAARRKRIASGSSTAADEAAREARSIDFMRRGKENTTIARTTNAQAALAGEREERASQDNRLGIRTAAATASLIPRTQQLPGGGTVVSQGNNLEVVQPPQSERIDTPIFDAEGNQIGTREGSFNPTTGESTFNDDAIQQEIADLEQQNIDEQGQVEARALTNESDQFHENNKRIAQLQKQLLRSQRSGGGVRRGTSTAGRRTGGLGVPQGRGSTRGNASAPNEQLIKAFQKKFPGRTRKEIIEAMNRTATRAAAA